MLDRDSKKKRGWDRQMRAGRLLLIASATMAAAAISRGARAQGQAPQRIDVAVTVVCPPETASDLVERLRDIVEEGAPGESRWLDLGIAPRFEPGEMFELPPAGSDRAHAWVVVAGPAAQVRAAAAGRERFVFRDLAVSQPLSEIDRERIGQMLKVALTTVVEGGQGALGRAAAQAAAGVPASPSKSPLLVTTSPPPQAWDQEPTLHSVAPPDPSFKLGLGAFMEFARLHGDFAYGPGVVVNALETEDYLRAGIWVLLMAFLPHDIATDSQSAIYGASFRAGINVAATALPWLSVDLGAGYDWPRPTYFGGGQREIGVFRFAVRAGPADLAGVRTALALILEYSSQSLDRAVGGVTSANDTRPAVALELWWR